MTLRTLNSLSLSLALALVVALGACASEPETPPVAADTSLSAPAILLHLTAVPAVFEVETNDEEGLSLSAASLPGPSSVGITLGEYEPGGINIFERVEEQLASFTELPGGSSFGQTQLVAPIGLTFMLRGRYTDGDQELEELRAILVHPAGNRLLTASYSYPVGDDTTERGQQLMELLGEMEPIEEEESPQA